MSELLNDNTTAIGSVSVADADALSGRYHLELTGQYIDPDRKGTTFYGRPPAMLATSHCFSAVV